jgi:hypothetical protein
VTTVEIVLEALGVVHVVRRLAGLAVAQEVEEKHTPSLQLPGERFVDGTTVRETVHDDDRRISARVVGDDQFTGGPRYAPNRWRAYSLRPHRFLLQSASMRTGQPRTTTPGAASRAALIAPPGLK